MKVYNTILFDLDGTITNSKIGIINSIKYSLKKFNITEKDDEKLIKYIGPPLQETFKKYYKFNESKIKLAIEYYREYYRDKGIYENYLFNDIEELLNYLSVKNKKIILATSKATMFAIEILKNFKIDKYFFDIIGSSLNGSMINKTEIISFIMNKFNFNKDEVIMIGDREYDIIGANNNQIDSIAVTYGYGNIKELKRQNPTFIINTIKEVRNII